VNFFDADGLSGEDGAEVDFLLAQTVITMLYLRKYFALSSEKLAHKVTAIPAQDSSREAAKLYC